ncbi:hypothetical protein Agabi119p4_11056 [Agaricus bisporus var. burnettii]|uniref:HNH nuclease domain-containing protein n=1 Tax=Agaricus bisporus var. burnettii TaxID=192524 RepID=A0A8H7C1R2_AGABI|nr:hypothetical protein Agabi119p4_11056 [Agaricus bisporus var. burnettii]
MFVVLPIDIVIGDYNFIDCNLINEQIITSEETQHSSRFRSQIMERDGTKCTVFEDRRHLYDSNLEPSDLDINSVENGIFLRADLHLSFAHGECAFLKTPNFALDVADIPGLEEGHMPTNRITLHHLEPDTSHCPVPQLDAHISQAAISPPSPLILDFMYGIAVFQQWGKGQDIQNIIQQHFNERPKWSDGMLQAMDDVLALSMFFKGVTPESKARERQRQEEAAEEPDPNLNGPMCIVYCFT